MNELRRRFGNLVAAHRRQQGMTQEALSTKAELSVDMISRIEAGSTGTSFTSIEKLAAALAVDPAEFFSANVPRGALDRPRLTAITARISKLSDADLDWLDDVLKAVLKHR
jgi:transcriptional regulator with XRE-family HTH domain